MTEQRPEEILSRKDLFLGLIHSFQAAAMQQMGKIANPYTDKIERDMRQARLSIDMLEMLEERTSGNLTGEESRFLQHVLTELRLNYVAEIEEDSKGSSPPAPQSQPTPPQSPPPTQSPPPPQSPPTPETPKP